jgi:hypothetical protein
MLLFWSSQSSSLRTQSTFGSHFVDSASGVAEAILVEIIPDGDVAHAVFVDLAVAVVVDPITAQLGAVVVDGGVVVVAVVARVPRTAAGEARFVVTIVIAVDVRQQEAFGHDAAREQGRSEQGSGP